MTEQINVLTEVHPKVSVIIPVYNAKATLQRCLDSIFSSFYRNFEVIVVDDCSNDGCEEVYRKFLCKIIRINKRSGPGKARNIGAIHSKGSILLFIDADCIAGKDWIEKMVNRLCENSVVAVGSGYSFSAGNSKIEKFAFLELKYRTRKIPQFIESLDSCNLACRKDAFLSVGGFPVHLRYAGSEDFEFSYNLSRKNKLLWDKDNGVGHCFRVSVMEYLRQQYNCAKPLVNLYLRKPSLIVSKTHHKKNGYLSILFPLLLIIGLLFSLFETKWLLFSLASIFITPLNELGFLIFLAKKEGVNCVKNSGLNLSI